MQPSRNQLAAHDRTVTLQPKVMAVLYYLALHYERVVSGEELMEQLWAGRIVTQGSVQKSINSLRKALAEFLGDQEVITHYSKRGYQLMLVPAFINPQSSPETLAQPQAPARSKRGRNALLLGLAVLCLGFLALVLLQPPKEARILVPKNHKTHFAAVSEYINTKDHVRDAEPHPDGKHFVYVREKLSGRGQWEIESQLMIRNQKGEDWQIATSEGSWVSMAWSPGGEHLVAIEIWRQEGLPPTPNFFERANYLYTFHVFSLDLESNRLLEKHLLSQWQGRIYSVTWWDDRTIEFVATQGPDSSHERYRYTTDTQQLSVVSSPAHPLASAVLNKRTALVSAHQHQIKVDLIDEHQNIHATWLLDHAWVDISWIPDGSGILAYAKDQQKLLALYWDGQGQEIQLGRRIDRPASKPRYRPDGAAIYFTEEKPGSIIWLLTMDENKQLLTDRSEVNNAATFSAAGDRIVYTSLRDNQRHFWLQEQGVERQLTTQPLMQSVGGLVWSADDSKIVYKLGSQIIFLDPGTGREESLKLESADMEPLAFDAEKQLLFVTKSAAETTNIWTIHTETLQQKQLTFGAVGSALEYAGDIYFQYRSRKGLWVLRNADLKVERVMAALDANSQLLHVDPSGVYFITGGSCRESDVLHLGFNESVASVFLARTEKIVSTSSFHPRAGLLQSDCTLAESNILMLH